ncbi:MAG: ABC transporter substrate-binding protein, partial [Deltaproteobacteria bacterium]|nr:ABC transporter substrate-binding protein [Deltaproteobacteria bacterium]
MNRRIILVAVTMCLLALLGSAATVMAADMVRGVTDTEIVIGQWGPQTGPAALWGAVGRATGVYFEMINSEGGIHGRKIKYVLRDDAYQPAKTKAVAKELVEDIGVFAVVGGVGTSTGMAVREYLTVENNLPWVSPATGSSHWTNPFNKNIFSTFPQYFQEAYVQTQYAVETMGKKKVAFFYQNDDYGKEGLEGAQKYLSDNGMKLAAEIPVEVTDTDLKSHALKLKESDAEVVILWVLPKHGAMIVGICKAAGFNPQFMAASTLSDPDLMFKVSKGVWKDVIYGNFVNMQSPLVQKYLDAQKKWAPEEKISGLFYLAGFYFAEPLVKGLQLAGRDLNPESFRKAMEQIRDWSDWLGYGCTFTETDHQGVKSVYLEKCGDEGA